MQGTLIMLRRKRRLVSTDGKAVFKNLSLCPDESTEEWSTHPRTIHKFSFNQPTANTDTRLKQQQQNNNNKKIAYSLQTSIQLIVFIEIRILLSMLCVCK